MDYPEVVIVSAARTPIGRFQGTLSAIPAVELGGVAIKAAVERACIDGALVEEVLMGNVVQAGEGQARTRPATQGQGALEGDGPPGRQARDVGKTYSGSTSIA